MSAAPAFHVTRHDWDDGEITTLMCPDLSHQWRQIEIRVIWEMFHPGHWSSCEEQSVSWLKQPSSGHSRVIMLSSWRSRVTRLVDKSYQNNDQQLAISDNIWDLSNTHVDVVSVVDAYNSQDQSFWNIFSWRCWGWLEWEWVGVIVLRQYYDNIWQGAHVWHDPPHWLLQGVHSEHCLQGVLIFLSQLLCGQ